MSRGETSYIANVCGRSAYPNANFEDRGGEDPHLNHCTSIFVALRRRAWKLLRRVWRETTSNANADGPSKYSHANFEDRRPLLVVVANIHMRTLKTEAE